MSAVFEGRIQVNLRPWVSFWALFVREMHRFLKVVFQTVVSPLINASLYLLIFGISLGQNIQLKSNVPYISFLIPGLVMMAVLNNAFQNSSSSIVSGKFSGDLEDIKVVPLSSSMIAWAYSLGGLIRGFLVGFVTYIVGEIFTYIQYGQLSVPAHPLWLIYFLVVGGLTFAKLGIFVAFYAKTFDQMSAVGSFVLLPLIYLGGVFFPLSGLHPFWQEFSKINPVLYYINGVRYGMLGISDVDIGLAAILSFVSLAVFHFLALRSLRRGSYTRW